MRLWLYTTCVINERTGKTNINTGFSEALTKEEAVGHVYADAVKLYPSDAGYTPPKIDINDVTNTVRDFVERHK